MLPVVFFVALLVAPATSKNGPDRVEGNVRGFTQEQKDVIVQMHNYYRSQERATNIIKMEWNDELEAKAQRQANLCKFAHTPLDELTKTAGFEEIGESVYATWANTGFSTSRPMEFWATEKPNYDYDKSRCIFGSICGHYTQMVWHETYQVGCGVKKCKVIKGLKSVTPGKKKGFLMFCMYGPNQKHGLNRDGTQNLAFSKGKKCSQCPKSHPDCDDEFELCTNKNSKKTPTAKWECDNGYTEIEGKCFKLMTAKGELDYEAAKELCREEEEALIAMPKTKGITKGLEKLRKGSSVWLGIVHYRISFYWSDSTTIKKLNWAKQPGKKGKCGIMKKKGGKWYKSPCKDKKLTICEKDKTKIK